MRQRLPILAVFLVLAWHNVSANQETLSFRVSNGQIEAVVSGLASCGFFTLDPPHTIEIGLSVISINSIQGGNGGGCGSNPPPPVPYEVVAVLGNLPRQSYAVSWTTSDDIHTETRYPFLSATLIVGSVLPSAVPAVSEVAVIGLALLLSLAGWFVLRRRSL
jgi:hypothetical protein